MIVCGSLHEVESNMATLRTECLAPAEDIANIEARIRRIEQLLCDLLRYLEPDNH